MYCMDLHGPLYTQILSLAHPCHPAQVLLIPGDTFRAAAAEQLAEWGRRAGATMGSFREGARPQAVIAEVRAWVGGAQPDSHRLLGCLRTHLAVLQV